jgi:uncharacterized protein (TIGR02266 family)
MSASVEGRRYPRAKIKWPVVVKAGKATIDAVTLNITPSGVFISCPKPLRLSEIFELTITAPDYKRSITATAEVVWSNKYGPDDEVSPRGMGVQFTKISSEDRKFLAEAVLSHFKSKDLEPKFLETLKTIVIEPDE